MRARIGSFAVVGALAAGHAFAQFQVGPGYEAVAVDLAAPGAAVGGIDWLPDGRHAVAFDGAGLVTVDVELGAVTGTLFTPPPPAFGSFVCVDPTGSYVLFGESSTHNVWRVPLDGAPPSVVAVIPFNFSCVFRAPGLAYVAHGKPGFGETDIVLLDVASGGMDVVATVPGPSGPLALDGAGNLFYGENSPSFPAPVNGGRVYYWLPEQVEDALGPTHLTDADSSPFVFGMHAVTGLAFDEEGDLLVSDSIAGTLREYDPGALPKAEVAHTGSSGGAVLGIAMRGNGTTSKAQFNEFQPGHGGTLLAVTSDFASFAQVQVVRPRRLHLQVLPDPVAPGPFQVTASSGPPSGRLFLLAAAGMVAPEWSTPYAGVPFFFALDPATLVFLGPVMLDPTGNLQLDAINPGFGGIQVVIQGALISGFGGPLGSSDPLVLTLQ